MSKHYKRRYNKEKGYYEHFFEKYMIKEESKNFFGIYLRNFGNEILITSKSNLKQALKTVKLMEDAYQSGYEEAKERYDEYHFRYH